MKIKVFIAILVTVFVCYGKSQNSRIGDFNKIGWYNYFGTYKIDAKLSFHTEYQWRRVELINNWQQSLLRTGLNYEIKSNVQLRVGYAWIETFSYGDIPLNGFGKDFTEHRIFQMLTLSNKIGYVDFTHRFMLEQRWIGRYSTANLEKEDEFPFFNRARYMVRFQFPLKGNEIKDNIPYIAMYDELLIGFGKNVAENIFDQNRIGILVGYKFNPTIKLEIGYLNQIIQLSREINNQNVFQYNRGFLVNTIVNFN